MLPLLICLVALFSQVTDVAAQVPNQSVGEYRENQTQPATTDAAALQREYPSHVILRAAVLQAPPFAMMEADDRYNNDNSDTLQFEFTGFQPELLKRLQIFAKEQDNVTLSFDLKPSPSPQYNAALDLVANDCPTTIANDSSPCQQFDLILGDYYGTPERSVRVDFTPSCLRTTVATMTTTCQHQNNETEYTTTTTLKQADDNSATICVANGTYSKSIVMKQLPDAPYFACPTQQDCIAALTAGHCAMYADDELYLRYQATQDGTLQVEAAEGPFHTQYLVWPLRQDLDPTVSMLLKKWIYTAISNGTLDELYHQYFVVSSNQEKEEILCDRTVKHNHGNTVQGGVVVMEETQIPQWLTRLAYSMFGTNVLVISLCAIWLVWHRHSAQVRVSQPFFLLLVLLGCLISSSTILSMAQAERLGKRSNANDDDDDHYEDELDHHLVPVCMTIPWLYSIGFCITFGTLFAKIRRVFVVFKSAADMRRASVTFSETLGVIAIVLLLDVTILVLWTILDPLHWQRIIVVRADLSPSLNVETSEGYCTSNFWFIYASIMAALHLVLLGTSCYLCYMARDIPTKFSEAKYLSIAMVSNLQVFIIGVPILILLGTSTDPKTSFFTRSVIVWMNDLVVVTLIFGNLMYSFHFGISGVGRPTSINHGSSNNHGNDNKNINAVVRDAITRYSHIQRDRASSRAFSQLSSRQGSHLELHSSHSSAGLHGDGNGFADPMGA